MKIFFLFFLFIVINVNAMNCSDYSEFKQFNGHYYSVSIDKLTFESANQIAKNNGGTLAIPNSQEENDFIKNLIGGGSIGWIGIYDPNQLQNYCYGTNCIYDSSRFKDVKNNSLFFKNFYSNQPDNLVKEYDVVDSKQMVSPLGEHWVAMNGNNGKWYDFGNHADQYNNPVKYKAIFEFENLNECKPLTDDGVQELTGLFCNTKIWDSTIDTITMGQTLDCQVDSYGNTYCPSALAACGEQWDYENGYSVSGIGQVVDYTNKVSETLYVNKISKLSGLTVSRYGSNGYWLQDITSYDEGGNSSYAPFFQYGDSIRIGRDGNGYTISLNSTLDGLIVSRYGSNGYWLQDITSYDEGGNSSYAPFFQYGDSIRIGRDGNGYTISLNSTLDGLIVSRYGSNGYWLQDITSYDEGGNSSYAPFFQYGDSIRIGRDGNGYTISLNSILECPNGYIDNVTNCKKTTLICPNGYTETIGTETTKGQCKITQEYTYYNYLCNKSENSQGYNYVAVNSGGNTGKTDSDNTIINDLTAPLNSSTPPINNCKREKFTCLANSERPCSYVDNKWQCSPFPCMGQTNFENLDTQVGISDKDNDGWSEDGACTGTIYIFNGKSNKCRTWDMLFGLMGGGCCDKEKVFAGLVSCKENEKLLAKQREQKQAHYIGNFCSKQLKLGLAKICVQKSDSYCTFSSSLAKIIQEQGREQLGISWGSAENPECRGFTPEEFQKIDFSKIDLTEFVEDIQSSIQTSVIQNLGTYVKDKVEDFYGN